MRGLLLCPSCTEHWGNHQTMYKIIFNLGLPKLNCTWRRLNLGDKFNYLTTSKPFHVFRQPHGCKVTIRAVSSKWQNRWDNKLMKMGSTRCPPLLSWCDPLADYPCLSLGGTNKFLFRGWIFFFLVKNIQNESFWQQTNKMPKAYNQTEKKIKIKIKIPR